MLCISQNARFVRLVDAKVFQSHSIDGERIRTGIEAMRMQWLAAAHHADETVGRVFKAIQQGEVKVPVAALPVGRGTG